MEDSGVNSGVNSGVVVGSSMADIPNELTASIDDLARLISPSYSEMDYDELFDVRGMEGELEDVLKESVVVEDTGNGFFDEGEGGDDDIGGEITALYAGQRKIQEEINASNDSFAMGAAAALAVASPVKGVGSGMVLSSPLGAGMSPGGMSPAPLDNSVLKMMRKNSRRDSKKADELLKGTEELKKQLEALSTLATWNDQGDSEWQREGGEPQLRKLRTSTYIYVTTPA